MFLDGFLFGLGLVFSFIVIVTLFGLFVLIKEKYRDFVQDRSKEYQLDDEDLKLRPYVDYLHRDQRLREKSQEEEYRRLAEIEEKNSPTGYIIKSNDGTFDDINPEDTGFDTISKVIKDLRGEYKYNTSIKILYGRFANGLYKQDELFDGNLQEALEICRKVERSSYWASHPW